jgi:hypothetical protein
MAVAVVDICGSWGRLDHGGGFRKVGPALRKTDLKDIAQMMLAFMVDGIYVALSRRDD